MMIWWTFFSISMDSDSEMLGMRIGWISIASSSNSGMNSEPRNGRVESDASNKAVAMTIVRTLCLRAFSRTGV